MNRETIGIIGLGLMGQNIAIACVRAGYRVVASDSMPGRVAAFIDDNPELGDRISQAQTMDSYAPCSLIIEAVIEELATKLEIFAQLEGAAPHATIASNSSTFMPSELACSLADKSRLLVCHFFNPADVVPLVEIVPSPLTDPDRVHEVKEFALAIGKMPVLLNQEIEGFVANRLQAAVLRECYALVEGGIASPETVDEVVRLSLGPRWAANGPIATADLGGLDIFSALSDRLFPLLDRSTSAQQTLRQHVQNGEFGAKVGVGVYNWSASRREEASEHLAEFFRFGKLMNATNLHASGNEQVMPVGSVMPLGKMQ